MLDKNRLAKSVQAASMPSDVSSAIMEAFNAGRGLQADRAGNEIVRIQSSSLLDSETCDYCKGWDGKEWTPGGAGAPPQQPPYKQCGEGYGKCRCLWVYIFKREPYVPPLPPVEPTRPPTPEPAKPSGININTVGAVKQVEVERARRAIDGMPEGFKAGFKTVEIHEEQGYEFKVGNRSFRAGGNYNPSLSMATHFGGVKNDSDAMWIIGHEIGHHTFEKVLTSEQMREFMGATAAEGAISPYAREHYLIDPYQGIDENFAEWSKMYLMTSKGETVIGMTREQYADRYPQQAAIFDRIWREQGGS